MNKKRTRLSASIFVSMNRKERRIALALLMLVGLFVGFYVALYDDAAQGSVVIAFLAYIVALAIPFIFPGFRPSIFHPLVFYVIWRGFRELLTGQAVLAASGLTFHYALLGLSVDDLNALVAKSFLLETLALVSLYVGYALAPRFRIRTMRVPRVSGLVSKSILWVGISGAGLLVLSNYAGGIEEVLMQRGIASTERISAQAGGHWNWLAGIGVVVPLLWFASNSGVIRKPHFWLVTVAAILIKFAATGSRGGTLIPLIMLGSIWMLHHQRIPYKAITIGAMLALVTVGGLGEFRAQTQINNRFSDVTINMELGEWLTESLGELSANVGENSGQLAVLGAVSSGESLLFGQSYISIPFVFIPSALIGDKPEAAGKLVADRIYGRPLTGIPPGAIGEAYWNFSYAGVVFVFMLYGLVLKFFSSLYACNPNHPLVVVIYLYVLFYMVPHSPSLYGVFQLLVPVLIIWWTLTARVPRFARRRSAMAIDRTE